MSLRFPGVPIRRTISIVAREEEGDVIATRIQKAALDLITGIFLPSVKANTLDAFEDIEVFKDAKPVCAGSTRTK